MYNIQFDDEIREVQSHTILCMPTTAVSIIIVSWELIMMQIFICIGRRVARKTGGTIITYLYAEVTTLHIGPCEPDARYVVVVYLLPCKTHYIYMQYRLFVCNTSRDPRAEFRYIYKCIFKGYLMNNNKPPFVVVYNCILQQCSIL